MMLLGAALALLLGTGCGAISEEMSMPPECSEGGCYVVTQRNKTQGIYFTTTIQPIKGIKSAKDFYAYNTAYVSSANTGFERSNESTIFVYHDTVQDKFSLFMIHDKPNDGSGGAMWLKLSGLGNLSERIFDDGNEGFPVPITTDIVEAHWGWGDCCTDGMAITFSSQDICVTIIPEKEDKEKEIKGINRWTLLSGTGDLVHLPSLKDAFEICFNRAPTANAGPPQTLECIDGGATATLDGTRSSDPEGKPLTYRWLIDETRSRTGAIVTERLLLGSHTADLTVSDGFCSDTHRTTVNVVDTTPPEILVGSPLYSWPPNHKYRTVKLSDCKITVRDACEGLLDLASAKAAITCVSSDEAPNGHGDGNTSADIEFVDATTVRLRTERQGPSDGRVYKIGFTVQDSSGNKALGTCVVGVPHDQSGRPAVDSGESYRACRQ